MARESNRLTVATIKAASAGDTLEDGGGLRCIVGEHSHKWVLRYTSPVTHKRREAGLGAGLTLKAARERAEALRSVVRLGRDPIVDAEQAAAAEREAQATRKREAARSAATLRACARSYHSTIAGAFRNRKHRAQWLASIEGSLPAKILDKPIAAVSADDLLGVLLPLMDRVPETTRRVRQRLEATFDDAILRELADRNPAAALRRRLRGKRQESHLRALPYADVPDLLTKLRASDRVGLSVRLCVLFAVATAARSGEARGATWGEIDLAARTWLVPGSRMKGGAEHRVALSDFALGVLREAQALRASDKPGALLFPAPRDAERALSDMTLTQALRRLETGATRDDDKPETFADLTTMHGLARASFSTWANEAAKARPDVIEAALAHKEGDRVRASYNRATFERERRELLARWGTFIAAPKRAAGGAKIIALRH